MAYCKFGPNSDVHIYRSPGGITCSMCDLPERVGLRGLDFTCITPAEMLAHLRAHSDAGQSVPVDAVEQLQREG